MRLCAHTIHVCVFVWVSNVVTKTSTLWFKGAKKVSALRQHHSTVTVRE